MQGDSYRPSGSPPPAPRALADRLGGRPGPGPGPGPDRFDRDRFDARRSPPRGGPPQPRIDDRFDRTRASDLYTPGPEPPMPRRRSPPPPSRDFGPYRGPDRGPERDFGPPPPIARRYPSPPPMGFRDEPRGSPRRDARDFRDEREYRDARGFRGRDPRDVRDPRDFRSPPGPPGPPPLHERISRPADGGRTWAEPMSQQAISVSDRVTLGLSGRLTSSARGTGRRLVMRVVRRRLGPLPRGCRGRMTRRDDDGVGSLLVASQVESAWRAAQCGQVPVVQGRVSRHHGYMRWMDVREARSAIRNGLVRVT